MQCRLSNVRFWQGADCQSKSGPRPHLCQARSELILNALLATIDESELSPEQVKALRKCVDRINLAREKGGQA
ncbi:hypothetical protein CIW56_05980 [Enterobacter roggenkampii]|nr:hypothetical protein CIW56_05980 [Enterobacter roggenkampii]